MPGSLLAWPPLATSYRLHLFHIRPATLALAALAVLALYLLLVIAKPTRRCGRCHGERMRVTQHWLSGRFRTSKCRRCHATGRCARRGARTVHRLIWTIRNERANPAPNADYYRALIERNPR